jgi:beta-xylosidase
MALCAGVNMERGKIVNVARSQQVNNFEHLKYGNITPTDLDALIEYHDKAYILIEIKYQDKQFPFGQKLAIQRMVNDLSNGGKKVIAIVGEHCVEDVEEHIDVSECNVREFYLFSEKKWRPPRHDMTVKNLIDMFIERVDG